MGLMYAEEKNYAKSIEFYEQAMAEKIAQEFAKNVKKK